MILGHGSFGWTWPARPGGVLAREVHRSARLGVFNERK
jgi:hypothetical protein